MKFLAGVFALLMCLSGCDLGQNPKLPPGLSDLPGAPTSVVPVAGFSEITLSWDAPLIIGGTPIQGYKVRVVDDTSKQCSRVVTSSVDTSVVDTLSCTVTGLENGVSYRFVVVAMNAFGPGTPSDTVELAPVGGTAVPTQPLNVVAAGDNKQVTISWKAPANQGGSPIVLYEVVEVLDSRLRCQTTGIRTCTVTGLTNGNSYSFKVKATNVYGAGPVSAVSNTSIPGILPIKPTNLTIMPGNAQVTVSWASPEGADYLKVMVIGDTTRFCITTGLSCSVTGLKNGTAYSFYLRSWNVTGPTPLYYLPGPISPYDQPIAPDAPFITLAGAGDGEAQITWTPPASDGGLPITGYIVTASPAKPVRQCTTTDSLTCTISGLTSGVAYTFTVKAINAIGPGKASAPSQPVTPIVIGATWTKQIVPTSVQLQGVVWTGDQLVAVGENGVVVTSPDGLTWTTHSMGTASYYGVAWTGSTTGSGNGSLVAVSTAGGVATSSDGVAWTTGNAGVSQSLYGITWTGTQLVAVGAAGAIVTSPDGLVWRPRSGTTSDLFGVASSRAGRLVAVGKDGLILTSEDGAAWTTAVSGTGNSLYGVTWTGTQFVAVGAGGTILVSADGFAWTPVEGGAGTLTSVVQTGIKVMVAGNAGVIYSVSGNTATPLTSGVTGALKAITWTGLRAVVLGASGTALTSP